MTIKSGGFNRYEPPSPSIASDEPVDESFLKDVNKLFDDLPQPFRRIDKLLNEIYEIAWEEIEKRECERIHKESTKVNLPKELYEEELLVKENVECITVSTNYLFLGLSNRIIVYVLPEMRLVCTYEWNIEDDDSNCVSSVKDIQVIGQAQGGVVLTTMDEKGYLKILGFWMDCFVVIESLNTQDTSGAWNIADQIYLSEDGTTLAVFWRDGNKTWLDVYKLPLDLWLSELTSKNEEKEKEKDEEIEPAVEEEVSSPVDFHKVIHQFKLSPPEVKPCMTSLPVLMKNFNAETPLIGTGAFHCLSSNFFKNLATEFKMKCNLSESTDLFQGIDSKPTIHFLKGQLHSSLFPTRSHGDYVNAVACWWEKHNQLNCYMLKQSREQPDPYFVLPHADRIELSCTNSQTNLIATYITNGCITIWNRSFGHAVSVFHPDDTEEITLFNFSTVYDKEIEDRLTYATTSGNVWQVTCGRTDIKAPVCLDDRSSAILGNDCIKSSVKSPDNLLTFIWSSGQVVIYNEIKSSPLCQLEIFNEDLYSGDKLRAVYAEKFLIVKREENYGTETHSRFFIFHLNDSTILKPFVECDHSKPADEETGDNLNNYYLRFLNECNANQSALYARVQNLYQETITT